MALDIEQFKYKIHGQDAISAKGLLLVAKERYPSLQITMEVELIVPNELAVIKCAVETADGDCYENVGDATPQNVGTNIKPHFIRMAATRAQARALRDLLGIADVSDVELGHDSREVAQPEQTTDPVKSYIAGDVAHIADDEHHHTDQQRAEFFANLETLGVDYYKKYRPKRGSIKEKTYNEMADILAGQRMEIQRRQAEGG